MTPMHRTRTTERGIALITTMLITMLMSALMIGFSAAVTSDQRYRSLDRDRVRAFYAATSGLEKLSADLATLFFANVAPSDAQVAALGEAEDEPDLDGVTFTTGGDAEAYGITPVALPEGDDGWAQVSSGPYQGLIALKKSYRLDSAVRTTTGGEAHVTRFVDTVAIPVFQFGMFSDVDLSFHAGPNFQFGGRIHSNANLFLAQGDGTTLTLPEKVTAVGEVVREYLVNGRRVNVTNHEGTVRMARAPGAYRNLGIEEASVQDSIGSALNSQWTNLSLSTYNGYIRNGRTGAKTLNLPVITLGGANVDIARRPVASEDTANPTLLAERYYSKVSLRILLSDTAADVTSLPGVTATAPVSLENWQATPPPGYVVGAGRPPVARAVGPAPVTPTLRADVDDSGDTSIRLDANVPAFYKHTNPLTVTTLGINMGTITCTGKRATRFTGCSGLALIADGSTVSGTVDTVEGSVTVSTTAQGLWLGGDLNVASTLAFSRNTFWVRNADDENVLVTCRGYDSADRFWQCHVPADLDEDAEIRSQSLVSAGTGTVGGFLKIEMQDVNNEWRDVTAELLNHGIAGPDLTGRCADPTPNAIIRIQRLRDTMEPAGSCSYAGSTSSGDYWPNTLYDAREALYRNASPGNTRIRPGGVMHYVSLDVQNLSEWLRGDGVYAGGSGPQALSVNGYSVYFSDRRNNRDAGHQETGELGNEDIINPGANGGASNAQLDGGEDVNASGQLDTYGQLPSYDGARSAVPPGAAAPLDINARMTTNIERGHAQVNRAIFFRRALKLINGARGNIVSPGLTIVAENPVYVHGDWNFDEASRLDPSLTHAATAIISDAVTILSNAWTDNNSFASPHTPGNRARSANSYYRFAVIAGKNAPFTRADVVDGGDEDFGTDGGAHNFLRMLEGGAGTVNYRGSIATFYFSRQAVGVYKGGVVYGAPTRAFNFDTDFLNPSLLPPLTPVFRDINARGFTQEIRPGR